MILVIVSLLVQLFRLVIEGGMLDCESLDNHKVRDHIDMSCKPYLLMRCCHDPLMSCQ
jgi:hypothetical protein